MPPTRDEQFDALSNAIRRVLVPVMICMCLSIWFVNSLGSNQGNPKSCRKSQEDRKIELGYEPGVSSTSSSTETSTLFSILFIAIFVVLIVVFTFFMVWLYKSGRQRIIQIWLNVAVFLVLAYVGGIYIFDFCRSHCIDLDWISLVFIIWNFSVGGLFAVFGRVPRFINQAYLIVISSLMAYIFRSLPDYSVWIILGVLVAWDLFAVLSPYGPLNLLVQAAREREDDLPALVYDTNPVAPGREPYTDLSTASSLRARKRQAAANSNPTNTAITTTTTPSLPNPASGPSSSDPAGQTSSPASSSPQETKAPMAASTSIPPPVPNSSKNSKGRRNWTRRNKEGNKAVGGDGDKSNGQSEQKTEGGLPTTADGEVKIGTLGTHLKLGLGDFVFYSILVAQASKGGPMSTIASFVAILAGLCATLFLVTIMRKALPALPISITAGLVTYFLTRYTVRPFVENLLPELHFY